MRNKDYRIAQLEQELAEIRSKNDRLERELSDRKREIVELNAAPENCTIEDVLQAMRNKLYQSVQQLNVNEAAPWANYTANTPHGCTWNLSIMVDTYCKLSLYDKLMQKCGTV